MKRTTASRMTKRNDRVEEKAHKLKAIQRQWVAEARLRKITVEIRTAENKFNKINSAIEIAQAEQREVTNLLREAKQNLYQLKEEVEYLQYDSASVSS